MPEPIELTPNCEHDYAFRILGGHPMHVRICTFCHSPDWADLAEQADVLYRRGHEEALAGKPPRDRLSAYDRPSRDAAETAPDGAAPDPLAPFRALADRYTAKAAESIRNAKIADDDDEIRTSLRGVAAGWRSAEFLLRHTLNSLDNHRTTPDNPEPAERCGHLSPRTMLGRSPVECVLRPGHSGSHAAENGANWRWTGPGPESWGASAIDDAFAARDAELEQLRAELDALRAIATGYCPHCGRGDCAPTPDQYLEQVRLADEADIIVDRIRAIAVDLRNDPDARYWANLIDTALDTPEYP